MATREKVYLKDTAIWDSIDHEASKEQFPETYDKLARLTRGSDLKLVWACSVGHSWQAKISNRSSGRGCPFCSGLRVSDSNRLSINRPELAREWDSDKNELAPSEVTVSSNKKIWWACPEGHSWEAKINHRSKGDGCPFCSGRRLSDSNRLSVNNPELAQEWAFDKNDLTPYDVSVSSNKRVWWKCAKEEHPSWKTAVYNRTNGSICPYCNSRAVCFANSVAGTNPVAAAEWCTELNSGVTPDTVSAKANSRVWWTCYITEHPPWLMTPNQRARGQGCPYCAGRHAWKRDNLLERRPDIASYWDINRNTPVTPDQVKPHSDRKVWWTCPAGKHPPHMSAVKDRVRGKGCPQCAKKYGRLEKRFGKRFALRGFTPEGYSVKLPDLSYESGKKGVEVDIPLAHDSGNQLLIEIDGERWHKDLGDMDAYKSELLSNLDDNTYHARVRLDNLPFLDFEHERFGQWRYFYDASDDSGIDEVVSDIVEWFNNEIGE